MAQVMEYLPSKHEAPSSNPSTSKRKKKKKKKETKHQELGIKLSSKVLALLVQGPGF
jgi:hypothetical protein